MDQLLGALQCEKLKGREVKEFHAAPIRRKTLGFAINHVVQHHLLATALQKPKAVAGEMKPIADIIACPQFSQVTCAG